MAIGVKVQGTRAGAGAGPICADRSQPRCSRIQAVDVDAVAAQIVDVGEAVVGRERSEVGVSAP